MSEKLVLIGQAPSRLGDALRPLSGGRVGAKLVDLLGVDDVTYHEATIRVNLIASWPGKAGKGDRFNRETAINSARAMAPFLAGHRVVFLGGGVARAFGRPRLPPLSWGSTTSYDYALLPHPSGVSLWWNLPSNQVAAYKFMREVGRSLTK